MAPTKKTATSEDSQPQRNLSATGSNPHPNRTRGSLNLKKCSLCGVERSYGHFDIHHINGDRNDNRPENLLVLCRDCHINIENGYATTVFLSDTDGVREEDEGILTDEF